MNKISLPGIDRRDQDTLDRLMDGLEAKTRRNLLRASYYDGKRAISQIGTVIPPQYYRLGIVLGWSAKAVDILARRCNLDGFVWPDGDLDALGFGELDEANMIGAEVHSAVVSSLIHGVSYLITTAGTAGEPAGLVHAKSALDAYGEWNNRAKRLDNLLSITDRDEKGPTGLALYLDGRTITARKDKGRWTAEVQTHPWGVTAEPLVYKPRVGRPFGTSRISRPVMSLHDQALRTVIRMEGHADVYSFPEMWLLGADESIFRNADGTAKASWQVMLGRIKAIPDDEDATTPRAEVKQFRASDPEPHLKQLRQQAQLFSGETSIPLSSLGVSDMSNPTSAESYIASREDLIAEAEGATDDWTPPLRRTIRRLLAIAHDEAAPPEEWRTMAPKWRSPVHLSRAAQADAGMKQLAAVPWLADTDVGLELLGLSEQQIERANAARRRSQAVTLLEQLRQAPAPSDDP